MEPKILFFVSPLLRELAEQAVSERVSSHPCRIEFIEYHNFEELPGLYKIHEASCDAIIVYGQVAGSIVRKAADDQKRIWTFDTDAASFYKLLVHLFIKYKYDPKRILFDYLCLISDDPTMEFYLEQIDNDASKSDEMLLEWENKQKDKNKTLVEPLLLEKIVDAWAKKEADLVLCTFSTLAPQLEERNIKYQYIFPSKEQIQDEITELCLRLEMDRLKKNYPAVVVVTTPISEGSDYEREQLKKALEKYNLELGANFLIQEFDKRLYLFSSAQQIRIYTQDYKKCFLHKELLSSCKMPVSVGYGIGSDIAKARSNAEIALKEALFARSSFVMDESSKLYGPMDSYRYQEIDAVITETITKIATECGFSSLTVQKLAAILRTQESSEITTHELAEKLGASVRYAQKVLSVLEENGYAEYVYARTTSVKGRPRKVYNLKLWS